MPKSHLPAILCGIVFSLSASAGVGSAEDSAVEGTGHIDAKSFRCITEMTHVRQFYVDNLLGNLDATLAVANSATGGTYPPGSVIQLVPGEAMVKRDGADGLSALVDCSGRRGELIIGNLTEALELSVAKLLLPGRRIGEGDEIASAPVVLREFRARLRPFDLGPDLAGKSNAWRSRRWLRLAGTPKHCRR
jgi:hypothetical protein